jgi:hypothetical protein
VVVVVAAVAAGVGVDYSCCNSDMSNSIVNYSRRLLLLATQFGVWALDLRLRLLDAENQIEDLQKNVKISYENYS